MPLSLALRLAHTKLWRKELQARGPFPPPRQDGRSAAERQAAATVKTFHCESDWHRGDSGAVS